MRANDHRIIITYLFSYFGRRADPPVLPLYTPLPIRVCRGVRTAIVRSTYDVTRCVYYFYFNRKHSCQHLFLTAANVRVKAKRVRRIYEEFNFNPCARISLSLTPFRSLGRPTTCSPCANRSLIIFNRRLEIAVPPQHGAGSETFAELLAYFRTIVRLLYCIVLAAVVVERKYIEKCVQRFRISLVLQVVAKSNQERRGLTQC